MPSRFTIPTLPCSGEYLGRFYISVERVRFMSSNNNHGTGVLAELCREAVEQCGGDWTRIRAYLRERVAQMSREEKALCDTEIERILSFTPLRQSRPH